jgi:hypothetical protein
MVAASVYRRMKLRGAPDRLCEFLGPKGNLSGLLGALDALLGDSMLWVVGVSGGRGDQ